MNEIIVRGLLCLKSMLSAISRQLSVKSLCRKNNNKIDKTSFLTIIGPYFLGRTAEFRDERLFWSGARRLILTMSDEVLVKSSLTPIARRSFVQFCNDVKAEYFKFDRRTTNFRNEQPIYSLVLGRTTVRRDEQPKIGSNYVSKVAYRCLRKISGTSYTLKPNSLYILAAAIAVKILFCVCLAHARRQGLGTPVATGVALKIEPVWMALPFCVNNLLNQK